MRSLLFSIALALMVPAAVSAQHPDDQKAQRAAAAPATLPLGAVAGTGIQDTRSVQLILDASKKEKKGTAALGWRDGQGNVQLTFSGPLDDNEHTEPISLIGLSSGASATLGFSRLNWRGPTPLEQKQMLDLCKSAGLDVASTDTTKTCELRNFTNSLDRAIFRQLSHLDDRPWMLGGEVGGSRVTQKYLENVTSAPTSTSRTTWRATGRAGIFTPGFGFTFLAYTYKEDFLPAGAPTQICRPVPDANALQCQNSIIGLPTTKTRSIISIETRKYIAAKAAVSPSVQWDLKNDVSAVEVPVYFLGDGTTPIGGVRFGWRSDTKELTAVVFIGAAFSMLPR